MITAIKRCRAFTSMLLATLLLVTIGSAWAQSYVWHDVVQDVEIRSDGTVIVTDERTLLAIGGDFNEAFICLDLDPDQTLELLDGGALGPGPSAQAYTQPCEDGSGGTELVVEMDNEQRIGARRVFYRYALSNTLDYYSDVVQWYWIIMEQDHPPVRGYELTVTTPGAMSAPYDAYVHRFSNPEIPDVSLSEERDELRVTFEQIPDGDGVEIRYLMDALLFDQRGSEPGFVQLLEDEERIGNNGVLRRLRAIIEGVDLLSGLIVLLAWTIALGLPAFVAFYAWYHGGNPTRPPQPQRFEPPSDLPPFAVALLSGNDPGQPKTNRAFAVTVMDLARRGYGKVKPFRVSRKRKGFELIFDLDRDQSELLPLEKMVLDYLHGAARRYGPPDRLNASDLILYSGSPSTSDDNLSKWGEFKRSWKIRTWVETKLGGELISAESRRTRKVSFMMVAVGAISLFLLLLLSIFLWQTFESARPILEAIEPPLLLSLFVFLPLAFIFLWREHMVLAWNEAIFDEVDGWRNFGQALRDYTVMRDAPNDFFLLWDRYFCYAAALGIAECYFKNVKQGLPEHGFDEQRTLQEARWLGQDTNSAHSTVDIPALLETVEAVAASLKTYSYVSTSSSGGSGGASGGGSRSGGR